MSTAATATATIVNASEIRRELDALTSRVATIEARLAQNGSPAPPATIDLASVMGQVREITEELFPGKCEFTSEFDPEYPEDRYVVVNVEASGEIKEIAARGGIWHDRIEQISDNLFGLLRLSILPR